MKRKEQEEEGDAEPDQVVPGAASHGERGYENTWAGARDTGKAQRRIPALVPCSGRLRAVLDHFPIGDFDLMDRILHRLVAYDEEMNRLRIRRPA